MVGLMLRADGGTDAYYLRFTTPKQKNLILGTSKAAQGLRPDAMHPILNTSVYNYSFDISKSQYGPKYLESIQKKLDPATKDGIFILAVDYWSLAGKGENPNDRSQFSENRSCVGEMETVDQNPNFQYLTHYLTGQYYRLIYKSQIAFLHSDGWLEVSLNENPTSVIRRTESTFKQYKVYQANYRYSPLRYEYLLKTIDFLKQHGQVYLVRLPVSQELLQVENTQFPEFDRRIQKAIAASDGYLDMTRKTETFGFIDGVHLEKKSGKKVSREVAEWIRQQRLK